MSFCMAFRASTQWGSCKWPSEVELLRLFPNRHPFIVGLKEVFLTPTYLGIAMEYVAGGNLYQKVRKDRYIPEPQARWLFQQLIIALDYAHRRVRHLIAGLKINYQLVPVLSKLWFFLRSPFTPPTCIW